MEEALTGATVEQIVAKIIAAVRPRVDDASARRLETWRAQHNIERAVVRLELGVGSVRTVFSPNVQRNLFTIYCATHLRFSPEHFGDENKIHPGAALVTRLVERVEDLPRGSWLVTGTTGQGKSFFLRCLAFRAALAGEVLPIFLKLEDHDGYGSLEAHILDELCCLGLEANPALLSTLLDSGRLLLLLDGYDEISDLHDRKAGLARELKQQSARHPKLRLLMTTRPGTGIEGQDPWQACEIAPLADYRQLLRHIYGRGDQVEAVLARIEAAPADVKQLLTTPLMADLAFLRFQAEGAVNSTADFFREVFPLLLSKHGPRAAGGRKSALADDALLLAFSRFALEVGRSPARGTRHERLMVLAAMQAALRDPEVALEAAKPADVLEDITAACILLREGVSYQFIHAAMQHYHAAHWVYLRSMKNDLELCSEMRKCWTAWKYELDFLELIDAGLYRRECAHKMFDDALGARTRPETRKAVLRCVAVEFRPTEADPTLGTVSSVRDTSDVGLLPLSWAVNRAFRRDPHLIKGFPEAVGATPFGLLPRAEDGRYANATLAQLFEKDIAKSPIFEFAERLVDRMHEEWSYVKPLSARSNERSRRPHGT